MMNKENVETAVAVPYRIFVHHSSFITQCLSPSHVAGEAVAREVMQKLLAGDGPHKRRRVRRNC